MKSRTIEDVRKNELWNEFKKSMGSDFIGVLKYHVAEAIGVPLDILVLHKPIEFKKLFIQVFGIHGWKIFIDVMLTICHKKGFDVKMVHDWFGIEGESNQIF